MLTVSPAHVSLAFFPPIWAALPVAHLNYWNLPEVRLQLSQPWTHVLHSVVEGKHTEHIVCKCNEHNV